MFCDACGGPIRSARDRGAKRIEIKIKNIRKADSDNTPTDVVRQFVRVHQLADNPECFIKMLRQLLADAERKQADNAAAAEEVDAGK